MVLFVLLALLLGGCAAPEPPSEPAPPAVLDRAAGEGVAADTAVYRADLRGVADSLHACIPAAYRTRPVRFETVGVVAPDGAPARVLLEYFDDADASAALDLHPVELRVTARGCEAVGAPDTDADAEAALALLDSPALAERSARLHVDAAGGAEAYLALFRRLTGAAPRACADGESPADVGCFPPAQADAYRAAGVLVD